MNGNNIIYFDSSGVEHTPKEIKKFIGDKNIIINIYAIHTYIRFNNVRILCVGFIDFMLKSKSLLDYIKLLSPNY